MSVRYAQPYGNGWLFAERVSLDWTSDSCLVLSLHRVTEHCPPLRMGHLALPSSGLTGRLDGKPRLVEHEGLDRWISSIRTSM